jgi:hypothetical protein
MKYNSPTQFPFFKTFGGKRVEERKIKNWAVVRLGNRAVVMVAKLFRSLHCSGRQSNPFITKW